MGDRMDNIQPGAMPWLHRYVGNPVLTGILNLFFRTGVHDAHCGMRALRRDVLPQLDLRTTGMEFASEMVIRPSKEKLEIREVADRVPPARRRVEALELPRRLAPPALPARPQPDLSLHRPGAMLVALGVLVSATVLAHVDIFGRSWQLHAMIGGALLHVVGVQVVALGLCAHAYGTYFMGEKDAWFDRMRARFRLEHGLAARRRDHGRRPGRRRWSSSSTGSTAASVRCPRSASRSSARRCSSSACRSSSASFLLQHPRAAARPQQGDRAAGGARRRDRRAAGHPRDAARRGLADAAAPAREQPRPRARVHRSCCRAASRPASPEPWVPGGTGSAARCRGTFGAPGAAAGAAAVTHAGHAHLHPRAAGLRRRATC